MLHWLKNVGLFVAATALVIAAGFAVWVVVWAVIERTGRVPGLLGLFLLLLIEGIRRQRAASRSARNAAEQRRWLNEGRWRS